tara:strand:+ start:463 stop:663 length:201 start_codon:yes stop_codon:yes gene_type:complete
MNSLQEKMFTDKETVVKRLAVCGSCPRKKLSRIVKVWSYCAECHCPLKAKTVLKRESCPLGKWNFV